MSGSIWGLPLSQQFDTHGDLLVGAPLTIYSAETLGLAAVWANEGLTVARPNPLHTDAYGRIPAFFLADGTYRAVFKTIDGVGIFDVTVTVGDTTTTGSGSNNSAMFQTGDPIWVPKAGTRVGWVRAAGRTISAAGAGGTEYQNADAANLYNFLWVTYSDAICPVTSGRGASASADFNAGKPIRVLDMRARLPYGLDDMGNTTAGRLAGVTFLQGGATQAASTFGGATHAIAQANLPAVNFNVTIPAGEGSHGHDLTNGDMVWRNTGAAAVAGGAAAGFNTATVSVNGNTLPIMHGTAASGGSGTALDTTSPGMLGTWYLKL